MADTDLITKAIHAAIENRTRKIADEEAEKAAANVERRVREDVGRIACVIFNEISFERFGRDLRITVQFPGGKDPVR